MFLPVAILLSVTSSVVFLDPSRFALVPPRLESEEVVMPSLRESEEVVMPSLCWM